MDPLRITVIIPTYNRQHTVGLAIASVLQQSYPVHEVIVVDDGSTDQTAVSIQTVRDQRVRYLFQQNAGAGAARNHGIRCATGNWLAFLDSDDIWDSDKLQQQVDWVLRRPHVDFVHTNRRHRLPDGTGTEGREGVGAQHLTDREFLLQNWVINTSTVMLRKRLFEAIGDSFTPGRRTCEDYEVWWRAVMLADEIGYVDAPVVTVVLGGDGISRGGMRSDMIEDNIYAMSRVIEWAAQRPGTTRYTPSLRRWRVSEYGRLFSHRFGERRLGLLMVDLFRCARTASISGLAVAAALALRAALSGTLQRLGGSGTR